MGELAIHGGPKIREHPMPARRALGDAEIAELHRAISFYQAQDVDPGYQGPFEEEFCAAYAEMMGGGYADAVSTGTGSVYDHPLYQDHNLCFYCTSCASQKYRIK